MRQRQIKIIETIKAQSTQKKKKSIRNSINEYLAKKKKTYLSDAATSSYLEYCSYFISSIVFMYSLYIYVAEAKPFVIVSLRLFFLYIINVSVGL